MAGVKALCISDGGFRFAVGGATEGIPITSASNCFCAHFFLSGSVKSEGSNWIFPIPPEESGLSINEPALNVETNGSEVACTGFLP